MPKGCCIVGCTNSNIKRKDLSFYMIPSEATEPERRVKWLQAIGREDPSTCTKMWRPKSDYHYVCSMHFVSGKKNNCPSHPDYVPSIFPTSKKTPSSTNRSIDHYMRALKRKGKPAYEMDASNPDWAPTLHLGYSEAPGTKSGQPTRRRRKQLKSVPEVTTVPEGEAQAKELKERKRDEKDGDQVDAEGVLHWLPAVAGTAVKEEDGDEAGAGAEEVEYWDGTVVKVEHWNGTDAGAAVKEEVEESREQTELKEPAAKRRRAECQLNERKMDKEFVKSDTDKMDEQYMNKSHKQACMDLENATQYITQALRQVNEQYGDKNHKQACMDLEQATERIIRALQNEMGRNQELCALIRQFQEREAETGRSLTEQMEANKQLKLRIDELQKRLEEKHNSLTQADQEKEAETRRILTEQMEANKQLKLKMDEQQKHLEEKHISLTQANKIVSLLKNQLRDLHHQLQILQRERTVQELNKGPQGGEKQFQVRLRELPYVSGSSVPHSKCSVVGCTDRHKSLHRLPAAGERRAAWLDFIFYGQVPEKVGRVMVCANHFKDDCFANLGQYKLGLANMILLNKGSVPTVRGKSRERSIDGEDAHPSAEHDQPVRKEVG